MKEKRTKKESNKEEAKKEGHTGLDFVPRQQASPSEDLKINWDVFIRFFNATLQMHGSAIRPIAYLSKGKKSRVQALVNRWNTKQALVDAVVSMARSDFLNGRKKGYPFIASFIWLTESDDHFEKVLNGYYDNPPAADLTPDERRHLAPLRRPPNPQSPKPALHQLNNKKSARPTDGQALMFIVHDSGKTVVISAARRDRWAWRRSGCRRRH